MKNPILILLLTIASTFTAWAADEFTQDASKLPEAARTYISQHFPSAKIAGIKIDKDFIVVEDYEVMLSDGTELDFRPNGELKEVKNKSAGLPNSVVPENVIAYVSSNYAGQKIVCYECKVYGCEIKLSSGLEIKFDKNGKFLGIDM